MGRPNTSGPGPHIELGMRARKAFNDVGLINGEPYKKVAKMLNMNESSVGKLFNGVNGAAYETLVLICKHTNCNFEWLATGRGEQQYSLTGTAIDISSVPPEKREAVRKIVSEVIKSFQE